MAHVAESFPGKIVRVPARHQRPNELGGVIIPCTDMTVEECLTKQIFGLAPLHHRYVVNIQPGLPLFLYNCNRQLHGIFEAASYGERNINPHDWTRDDSEKTPYPAQVLPSDTKSVTAKLKEPLGIKQESNETTDELLHSPEKLACGAWRARSVWHCLVDEPDYTSCNGSVHIAQNNEGAVLHDQANGQPEFHQNGFLIADDNNEDPDQPIQGPHQGVFVDLYLDDGLGFVHMQDLTHVTVLNIVNYHSWQHLLQRINELQPQHIPHQLYTEHSAWPGRTVIVDSATLVDAFQVNVTNWQEAKFGMVRIRLIITDPDD